MRRVRLDEPRRIRLGFVPTWEGPIEGWTVKFIDRNLWRVRPRHERNDLKQDAYYIFLRMKFRYPEVVDAPHFMSLYKRAFSNHVHDLSTERSTCKETSAEVVVDGEMVSLVDLAPSRDDAWEKMELRLLLEDAPEVVKKVLQEFEKEQTPVYLRQNGIRETTREFLERIAGAHGTDVLEQLRRWIGGIPQWA